MGLIISGKMEKNNQAIRPKTWHALSSSCKKKVSHENSFANFDGKKWTDSCKMTKILTTSGKSHHPIETFWVNDKLFLDHRYHIV